MPPDSSKSERELQEARESTAYARRIMRFKFAQRRMVHLRETEPKFTPEQIEALCAILRGEA